MSSPLRESGGCVGRLAPSPTGALHVGNARSFLLAWLSARQQQGRVLLRIEDIDSPRVKPWAVASTIADLRWLGLDWDAGPEVPDASERAMAAVAQRVPLVQSQRLERYRQVLAELIEGQVIYPCWCTRSEVAEAASAPHENAGQPLEGPVYPGTCRGLSGAARRRSEDRKFAWRWAFAAGEMQWWDGLRGAKRARPAEQLGDFVIARADGTPAYQLAVVIDDRDLGVSEVVRGNDLEFSTYRQLAILRYFGWPEPLYYHVPLMVGSDGRRLAKRHGDTRLSHYRQRGISPQSIVGYLAWTLNMLPKPREIEPRELLGQLDWRRLPPQPKTVFDESRLP
ncbi:MAG: tRNA glutamyl-Q(34) synthetase GluQRS [Planctomycetales bacterium]|nr:tRNA glutamyl-Q(34) synthetase GluQRS [Planctomycetales bacterium]